LKKQRTWWLRPAARSEEKNGASGDGASRGGRAPGIALRSPRRSEGQRKDGEERGVLEAVRRSSPTEGRTRRSSHYGRSSKQGNKRARVTAVCAAGDRETRRTGPRASCGRKLSACGYYRRLRSDLAAKPGATEKLKRSAEKNERHADRRDQASKIGARII
jgi:hypothetical protein